MDIAVILPCYNEEAAIEGVIKAFAKTLPTANIYVCDNNSSDHTAQKAIEAGAIVITEPRKGKGNAVRRLFRDVNADIYIMADGDGTYDVEAAPGMIKTLAQNNLDMVVGVRNEDDHANTSRKGHRFGNAMLNKIVNMIFPGQVEDMLSGYRVFSKRFVKTFPGFSGGFEIETELSIHAIQMNVPIANIATRYFDRTEGTQSKLSTYKDGFKILNFIVYLFKEGRPFPFFSIISGALLLASLMMFFPVLNEYFETGLVQRFPTLFVSVGLGLAALICFFCGIILDSVSRGRLENKKMFYLSYPTKNKT